MAGLGDVTAALGGIGEAINGGVSGYIEAKDKKRVTDRQDQLWNEQQDVKAAQDITDVGNVTQFADPNVHPIYQMDQWAQDIQKQASRAPGTQAQPATPQVGAQNAPASPAPAQGGLAQAVAQRQGSSPQPTATAQQSAPAPTAPPPGWEPSDPALKDLNTKYEKAQKQAAEDLAKIDLAAGNDPAKKQRMYAAYARLNKPKFDALDQDMQSYQKGVADKVFHQRAEMFVDSVVQGNVPAVESMFGKGAKPGTDPRTGLQGVILADGQFIGAATVRTSAMVKAGLASQKDVDNIQKEEAHDIADLMKERAKNSADMAKARMEVGARYSEARNKDIEKANRIGELTVALAKERDPTRQQAIQAQLDSLKVDQTRAGNTAVHNAALEALRGDQQAYAEVDKAIKNATAWNPDEGVLKPKISPAQALDRFKQLQKKNPAAAAAYTSGLPAELNTGITTYINAQAGQDDQKREALRASGTGQAQAKPSQKNPFQKPASGPTVGADTKLKDGSYTVSGKTVTVSGGKVVKIS